MGRKIIVLADLGELKAYSITRDLLQTTPTLELVADVEFTQTHGRFLDKYTDQAGRFPAYGQGHMAIGEQHDIELEEHRRLIKAIAQMINELLKREDAEYWSFAAAPEINEKILELVELELRRKLVRNLPHDLVKASKEDLLERF